MNHLRASNLPVLLRCSGALTLYPDTHDSTSDAAEAGTLIHARLAQYVSTGERNDSGLSDEERFLYWQGVKIWDEVREWFPEPKVEREMRTNGVLMHPDAYSTGNGYVRVLDWKSGRIDSDYTYQLMAYIDGIVQVHHAEPPAEMTVITAWLREGEYETRRFTAENLGDYHNRLAALQYEAPKFTRGPHCRYCRAAAICPAVRTDLAAVNVTEPLDLSEMTPERLADLRGKAKLLQRFLDDFDAAIHAWVAAHGPLPVYEGHELAMVEQNRRCLDARRSVPVLVRYLTEDELAQATTISISQCEQAAVKKAEKGKGAATKREMTAALEEAGAMYTHKTYQLRERKVLQIAERKGEADER